MQAMYGRKDLRMWGGGDSDVGRGVWGSAEWQGNEVKACMRLSFI